MISMAQAQAGLVVVVVGVVTWIGMIAWALWSRGRMVGDGLGVDYGNERQAE